MAVDTRSRRASVLGIALAVNLTLPLSDGTVGQADRPHVAFCYAATPSVAVPDQGRVVLGMTATPNPPTVGEVWG